MRSLLFPAAASLAALLAVSPAVALPLGVNKVRHHTDRNWKILVTEHFEIFYDEPLEAVAREAVSYAEDAFLKISRHLDYVPNKRIPLFLYGTPAEFQETNITPVFLPEGVGGFTEAFKNRVVVPVNGYPADLRNVILHEVVHAFQYNLIYGEGWRSLNLWKSVFVPVWIMEGTAEWMAEDWDLQGEMVLRDAALSDRLMPMGLLSTFDHFEEVFLAYKQSHSFLEYVADVYGPEKVPLLLRRMAASQNPGAVVEKTVGVPFHKLSEDWIFYLKTRAFERVAGRPQPERYGSQIRAETAKARVSPDGSRVAVLDGRGLHVFDAKTGRTLRSVGRQVQSQGSGAAWSPDGTRLAFASRKGAGYVLTLMDVSTGKMNDHRFEGLPFLFSPAFTADGSAVLFTAFDYVRADLYRFDPAAGALARLTNTPEVETWTQAAPDGRSLYFVAGDGDSTEVRALPLNEEGMPSGPARKVGTDLGTVTSLCLSEGRLWLTSDRDGRILNLYRMEIDGSDLRQATRGFVDVLSADIPPAGGDAWAVLFRRGATSLWRLEKEKLESRPAPPPDLVFLSNSFERAGEVTSTTVAAAPTAVASPPEEEDSASPTGKEEAPAVPEIPPPPVTGLSVAEATNLVKLEWKIPEGFEATVERFRVYRAEGEEGEFVYLGSTTSGKKNRFTDYQVSPGRKYRYYVTGVNALGEGPPSVKVEAVPEFQVTAKDYRFRMSPDLLFFLAGYDSSFGFAGFGLVSLSDYLGNHRLSLLGDSIPGVRSGVQAGYGWYAKRTAVEADFYHFENFFRLVDLRTGNIVDEFRDNEMGGLLNLIHPLSVSTRIETGVGTQRFEGSPSFLRLSEVLSNVFLEEAGRREVANFYRLSLVHEKRRGERFWAAGGQALNLTWVHSPGAFDATASFRNLLAEVQFYRRLPFYSPVILANRIQGLASSGRNPQTFFAAKDAPFRSYPTQMRGFGGEVFTGNYLVLWNAEMRFPIAKGLNFSMRPLSFILLKDVEIAVFSDVVSFGDRPEDLGRQRLKSSVGGGLRLYQFVHQRALLQLRLDVAWRTDRSAPPFYHFNLAPVF